MRATTMMAMSVLLLVGLAMIGPMACSDDEKTPPADRPGTGRTAGPDLSNPKTFFLHLHQLAKSGDAAAWKNVLSKRLRDEGDEHVRKHFKTWKKDILEMVQQHTGGNLDAVTAKVQDGNRLIVMLGEKETEIRVTTEDGQLRIDEN